MNMKRAREGFTLIELLVVIAIIGLLTSVVLASLKSARDKAADGAIKSNLRTVQTQAAIYYDNNNGSYGTDYYPAGFPASNLVACESTSAQALVTMFADSNIVAAITAAGKASTGATGVTAMAQGQCSVRAATASAPASYIVVMPLRANTDTTPFTGPDSSFVAWCVDSTGQSKQLSGTGWGISNGITQCP